MAPRPSGGRRTRRAAALPVAALSLALSVAIAIAAFALPARAMTMELAPVPGAAPAAALLLQGRIVDGDLARLRRALAQGGFAAVVLNSPGGSVVEARDMARLIRRAGVTVVVPARAVCASACFLLFAAGRDKVAEPGALIGVHSASVAGGNENLSTLAVTTLMAREAARYGVPAGITGRMVTTAPGAVAWLDRAELESMGARVESSAAAGGTEVLPGSGAAAPSDWTRGFERGRSGGPEADCAPPPGTANTADFALGCASGRRSGGARVAAAGGKSDWTRGFDDGRAPGGDAACRAGPPPGVVNGRDWSLGCYSGRRAVAPSALAPSRTAQ